MGWLLLQWLAKASVFIAIPRGCLGEGGSFGKEGLGWEDLGLDLMGLPAEVSDFWKRLKGCGAICAALEGLLQLGKYFLAAPGDFALHLGGEGGGLGQVLLEGTLDLVG